MKQKVLLLSLLGIIAQLTAYSQEMKMNGFKHLEGNVSARINEKEDVNGKKCAIVIIKSNFNNYKVESAKGVEGLNKKTGETWVWLSPDEYQLIIRKENYIPLQINLKDRLKELETYELLLTDEYGTLTVEAPGATIWLNNQQVGKGKYNARVKHGDYVLKATKLNCKQDLKLVSIIAGESINVTLAPIPITANVIIESNPPTTIGASIFIDDSLTMQKSPTVLPLLLGEHKITLKKNGFIDVSKIITLEEEKNYQIVFDMQKLKTDPRILKHKRSSTLWLTGTLVFTGGAIYSYTESQRLYDKYKTATVDAESIRKQYKLHQVIYPSAFGAAGICLTSFIIQKAKLAKVKSNLTFSFQRCQGLNNLAVCYKF